MFDRDYVYYLSVEQAETIEKRHENDPSWDIWKDIQAQVLGFLNKVKVQDRKAS